MLGQLRTLEQKLLPKPLIEARRHVQFFVQHGPGKYSLWAAEKKREAAMKRRHDALNPRAAGDTFTLREGISFRMKNPEARNSYEHFCHIAPDMVDEMDGFLEATRDKKALLDVGALHGIFSLAFTARPETRALAVEPSDTAGAILKEMVEDNARARVVKIITAPVSDRPQTIRMHREWQHFVVDGSAVAPEDPASAVSISSTTIDELLAEHDFVPDVMKIDIEGYEMNALRGAKKTLSEIRPLIFLEIHPDQLKNFGFSAREVADVLDSSSYEVTDSHGASLSPASIANLRDITRVICRPKIS